MRILLIEDEEQIAEFIKRALKAEGYSLDITPSGRKGVFLAKVNEYDIILSDVMLPDIDGFQVVKEIRESKKKVYIMMLTVKSELKDRVNAFDLGADDYLVKPFALEELIARIRAITRRPFILQDDVLKTSGLVLDVKKRKVTLNGQPMELRVKEIALLEYLMRNRGTVLSRGMILEHVWDMNADPFTNTVDVHIRTLRHKLGDEAGHIVKTVHGMGYKVD